MRKKYQEITDKGIIEEILKNGRICRIAMTDDDRPYLLPFNYGYRENAIYIHSAPEGKKINLLEKNNRVSFEVEAEAEIVKYKQACKWTTLYRSLIGYGEVEIISDFRKKEAGLRIIMEHNGMEGEISFGRKAVDDMVLLKLSIKSIHGKQSGNWNTIISNNRVEIETGRLTLKEISWEDLDKIHHIHSSPEVDEYNTLGIPKDFKETEALVRLIIAEQSKAIRKSYTWKIGLKESDAFIGIAGMTLSRDRFRLGEIYYNLFPEYWGKGYATEAAKALIRSGFKDFNLHKVEAGVATDNERSIRVLEKAGMTREGLRRKILPIRGEWRDNYHYAIVEDEAAE